MGKRIAIGVVALLAVLVLIGVLAGDDGDGGDNGTGLSTEGPVSTEAAAAGCLPVESEPVPKKNPFKHVNGEVDYDVEPPTMGDHSSRTLRNAKRFYSRDDMPPIEQAVHDLEHGLVVAWYDDELPDDEVAKLEGMAQGISTRFVAVPWSRSTFEDERHFVLTAWGFRQRCRSVSEQVVQQFVEDYADKLAPEKGYPV